MCEELRYNGQFGNANITTGIYWFDNDIEYHERRGLWRRATVSLRMDDADRPWRGKLQVQRVLVLTPKEGACLQWIQRPAALAIPSCRH